MALSQDNPILDYTKSYQYTPFSNNLKRGKNVQKIVMMVYIP